MAVPHDSLKAARGSPGHTTEWPWGNWAPKPPTFWPDGQPWPRVSIVTPSLNQGQFIEETIRSVLLQGYPNLEYIIIDGGSTDNTVEIIRKYEPWLAYWVSEPDRGQSHAINKGFARATGEIFGWLNSDDVYLPGALAHVARAWLSEPGNLVAAPVQNVLQRGEGAEPTKLYVPEGLSFEKLVRFWEAASVWHQPGIFFPARVWRLLGGLDESLGYMMDYDLICRALLDAGVTYVDETAARFRVHAASKTGSQSLQQAVERLAVSRRYWHLVPDIQPAACYASFADHLVRKSGTELLRGRVVSAVALMGASLRVSPAFTVRALARQVVEAARRRIVRSGP